MVTVWPYVQSQPILLKDIQHQVIVPRKGVLELARLMTEDSAKSVLFSAVTTFVRPQMNSLSSPNWSTESSLIMRRMLPRGGDKTVTADRQSLREALNRASILSNENTAVFAGSWNQAC